MDNDEHRWGNRTLTCVGGILAMRRSSLRRSHCPLRCGCFSWSSSRLRSRERKSRTTYHIERVIGSLRNPERDRCGWRARDIANWVVPWNAETAKEIENTDCAVLARNIHVVVGCVLVQRVAMTAGRIS